jgi:hypothetical protein
MIRVAIICIVLSTVTIAGAVVLHVVWYHQEEAAKAAKKAAEEDWTAHHCDNCQAPVTEYSLLCKRSLAEDGVRSPFWGRDCNSPR